MYRFSLNRVKKGQWILVGVNTVLWSAVAGLIWSSLDSFSVGPFIAAWAVALLISVASVAVVFVVMRNRGRHEVVDQNGQTKLVTGAELYAAAQPSLNLPTTIRPWQANVLLRGRCDIGATAVYGTELLVNGLVAGETNKLGGLKLHAGPNVALAEPMDALNVSRLVAAPAPDPATKSKRPNLRKGLREVRRELRIATDSSNVWRTANPGKTGSYFGIPWPVIALPLVIMVLLFVVSFFITTPIPLGIAFLMLPIHSAIVNFAVMGPALNARGSQLALDAASLRKGLESITTDQIRQLADQGQLSIYLVWAFSLGQWQAFAKKAKALGKEHPALQETKMLGKSAQVTQMSLGGNRNVFLYRAPLYVLLSSGQRV